jgi:hypothetical protein
MLLGVGFLIWAAAEIARGRRNVALVPLAAGIVGSAFGGFDKVGLILGVVAAVLGVVAYGRGTSRPGAWAGVLLLGLVAAVAAQAYAPAAAAVLAWPLALASVGAAATALACRKGYASLAILAVLAAIGLGWIGEVAHTTYVSLDLVELLAISALLAALLIWPLAQPQEGAPPARLIGPVLTALGFVVMLAVRLNSPYDARYPQASYVVYQVDQDAGRAHVVSATPERPAWATRALTAGGGAITKVKDANWGQPIDSAPAAFVQEPAPTLTLARQPDGALRLSVVAAPEAGGLVLRLTPSVAMTVEALSGAPVHMDLKAGKASRVRWSGAPAAVDLVLRPSGPGTLQVGYVEKFARWPAGVPPLPKRPPNVMPFDESDSTFVTGTRGLAW